MTSSRSAILRRGTAASIVLFVSFVAAWEWGPGLLGIPAFVVPPASAADPSGFTLLRIEPAHSEPRGSTRASLKRTVGHPSWL